MRTRTRGRKRLKSAAAPFVEVMGQWDDVLLAIDLARFPKGLKNIRIGRRHRGHAPLLTQSRRGAPAVFKEPGLPFAFHGFQNIKNSFGPVLKPLEIKRFGPGLKKMVSINIAENYRQAGSDSFEGRQWHPFIKRARHAKIRGLQRTSWVLGGSHHDDTLGVGQTANSLTEGVYVAYLGFLADKKHGQLSPSFLR